MAGLDQIIMDVEKKYQREIPNFKPGDTIRVYTKIKEGDKQRLQAFEGVVIRKRGSGNSASVTVRKVSYGVGVERIFPINSPIIDRIEVVKRGIVKRARLYYLRNLRGKAARVKEKKEWMTKRA